MVRIMIIDINDKYKFVKTTDIFRCRKHDFNSITQTICPLCELENKKKKER